MHLRSVTIRGFKSFASKAILRFQPGITVIVGPNGSGKSNITDAVLWVLGEQSAKNLRGASMEDIIFAGSTSKQALGTAEVAIALDNSDGKIPIAFSEVTISRRLFRSGESEYYLNRSQCRLIDIHEILSDTGLGREMYSVISQGRLDDILNSKPHERRQLLEEAAGVLKHKKRRDRALRKLLSMEMNLSRGKDILREVNRQVAPLKRQADQTLRVQELSKDLKDAQVAGAVAKLKQLQSRWEELRDEQASYKERFAGLKNEVGSAQEKITELEGELEAKGIFAGDIGEYRRRLEGMQERINSGLLLLEEKGKNLIQKLSELRQTIYQLESKIKSRSDEERKLEAEKAKLDSELGAVYQEIAEGRRETEAAKKQSRAAAQRLAELDGDLSALRATVSRSQAETHRALSQIEAGREKIAFLREQREAIDAKVAAMANELAAGSKEKDVLTKERSAVAQKLENAKTNLLDIEARSDEIARDREAETVKVGELKATLAALETFTAAGDADFSWFWRRRDDFAGTIGRLSEVISVEPKYEKALDSLLGRNIHAVLMEDIKAALSAFRAAKVEKGRPIRLMFPGGAGISASAPADLLTAASVVKCEARYRPAVDKLLANVWLTEDIGSWLETAPALPERGVVVDVNGDFFNGAGVLGCQGDDGKNSGSLRAGREKIEQQAKLKKAEERLRAAQTALEQIRSAKDAAKNETDQMSLEAQKSDNKIFGVSARINNQQNEIERLNAQKAEIDAELSAKEKSLLESEGLLRSIENDGAQTPERLEQAETKLKQEQKAFNEVLEAEKEAAAKLGRAQVEMASLTERQTHLKSRSIQITEELKQAKILLIQEEKIAGATEELRHRIQPVHDLYTALRVKAESQAIELEKAAGAEQEGAARMREDLRRCHQKMRDLSADLELCGEGLTAKEVAIAQVGTEVNQLTRYLVDELHVALESALAKEDQRHGPEYWREREEAIRRELEKIGPVNQIAADEFGKLSERQAFLTQQIEDLVGSQKALRKIVDAIDKKIKVKFQVTFDEVNANFARVFQDLFPGGSATLVLTEGVDEEEPGVEIEAQPHGKRLQSLSLLSGGERSLVGLAVLFALFYTRPSPFYILDEVEAALDDANLQRLIDLLHKLKRETQFLIITHQRRTMEVADCIYGVSMQADGISKVLSQKLSNEEIYERTGSETEVVAEAVAESEQVTPHSELSS